MKEDRHDEALASIVNQFDNYGNTCARASCRKILQIDDGWSFRRLSSESSSQDWHEVHLPHCPFAPELDGHNHWFGECEYRRGVTVPTPPAGARWVLFVGAAMHTAQILVDDHEIGRHVGGFLPFEVDLSDAIGDGEPHTLVVRVDNRYNPDVPPGKPFDELDFCWYGGLYRNVELRMYPSVHITDSVSAGEIAGGGIFVRTLAADESRAALHIGVHLRNSGVVIHGFRLNIDLLDRREIVASTTKKIAVLQAGGALGVEAILEVARPKLWAPDSPKLYELSVSVIADDESILDNVVERIGIRRIQLSRSGGFVMNGRRLRLRGTNRHQEFPRAGHAAPRAAQIRDARRIKEAGFDYVRLSHYPQSPDFLSACDELGIVVMNCLPGWQYLGGEQFRSACFEAARRMIRRDRNHPCVILWELSLNETAMDDDFMAKLHAIGHEEFPGDQMFTCGWIDRYDVFLRSRQHGELHTWKSGDKALVVAEYGDWEFYAANHGFDQKTGAGLFAHWSNGRKFRSDGERGLRQQVWNHMVALNDTLASSAVLDGQWSMFDYARGYDPVRAACGVMDVFRLPKFSYYFYRSQRDPREDGSLWTGGALVFIASHWLPNSDLRVPIFTNCETVELRLNGVPVERAKYRPTEEFPQLPHPPLFFELPRFAPGVLEVTGFINGSARCVHRVTTPGAVAAVSLWLDDLAIIPARGELDLLLLHAELRDVCGTLCVAETSEVEFTVDGDAVLLGPTIVAAEAGIASAVIRVNADPNGFTLTARSRCDAQFVAQRHVTPEARKTVAAIDVVTCHSRIPQNFTRDTRGS